MQIDDKSQELTTNKIIKFNNYLTDIKGNREILLNLIRQDKGLLKAPTGSGKTYSMLEVAKEDSLASGQRYIFAVPKTKQAQQIEKEYNIPSVTGVTRQVGGGNVVACVYDSIDKVFSLKQWTKDERVTVIVDECHRMIYDSTYRRQALDRIKGTIDKTKYIFISATPKVIEDSVAINMRVECKPRQTKYNYDIGMLYDYTTTEHEALLGVINTLTKPNLEGKRLKVLVFIDNKSKIERYKQTLEIDGHKVGVLTSDTKEEQAMETLVKDSLLRGYDIYLATSVIEEGINIKNEDKFACIYLIDNNSPNYDSIEQACARLRTKGHTCMIMRKHQEEEATIITEEQLQASKQELEEARKNIERVNAMYQLAKGLGGSIDIKTTIDGIVKGGYYILDGESDTWRLDEDRLKRVQHLAIHKTINSSIMLHKKEVMKRVKAKQWAIYKGVDIATEEQVESYKLASEIDKTKRELERETLLGTIRELSTQAYFTLQEFLITGTLGAKGVPISPQELDILKAIRDNKDIIKLLKKMNSIRLDIQDTLQEGDMDYKQLESYLRQETYKRYNAKTYKEVLEILDLSDLESSRYTKIRKIGDNLVGKTLSKDNLIKFYKVDNPNYRGKELSDKQLDKAREIIGQVYNLYETSKGRLKLGKLLVNK